MSSATDLSGSTLLSASGITIPRQAQLTSVLQAQWQAAFGAQVNLDPRSNNGQLIAIMAERFALLYELVEAVYNASYPSGAEGVAVDNLLALQGLTRLPASATKTGTSPVVQANGVTLYGLVCYGTAGTVIPAGSLVADGASPAHVFATDAAITIGPAQNAVQTLVFNPAPTSGTYALTLTAPSGTAYTTPAIAWNAALQSVQLTWAGTSSDTYGNFTLALSGLGSIALNTKSPLGPISGATMAALINKQFGLSTVTGSGDVYAGVTLNFGAAPTPIITASGTFPPTVTPSIATDINGLGYSAAATTQVMPFTDVALSQAGNVLTLSFGANSPATGQAATAGVAIPLVTVANNALMAGTAQTNVSVLNTVQGHAAQGVGSATCTEVGPTTVLAGAIDAIQTPLSGWDGVLNQLDCTTGSNAETDAEALARRASLVANQASGPLAAILQRVEEVSGVTAAIAVANSSMASQQIVTVSSGATAGSFALTVGGQTTATVPFNTSAGALQAVLRALTGYETAAVAGTATSGLTIDWGTSVGGQAVALAQVASNTTGVAVTVQFGRLPKSVEVVVQGGADSDVAQAIFASAPAGIATYGRPVLTTTATTTASQAAITVADTTGLVVGLGVQCVGVPPGATIASLAGNSVTLTAAALSSGSNVAASFGFYVPVTDSAGNTNIVRFSRPTQVQFFVQINLTVDTYNVPGQASSGVNTNSKWSAGSISAIQQAVKAAIQGVSIGGTLSATGSGGIANSFRDIAPGIEDAVVAFDSQANPTNTARITLAAEQVPEIDESNINVSFQ